MMAIFKYLKDYAIKEGIDLGVVVSCSHVWALERKHFLTKL